MPQTRTAGRAARSADSPRRPASQADPCGPAAGRTRSRATGNRGDRPVWPGHGGCGPAVAPARAARRAAAAAGDRA